MNDDRIKNVNNGSVRNIEDLSPWKKTQFQVFIDSKISASSNMANSHRMQPIDESSSPFSAC